MLWILLKTSSSETTVESNKYFVKKKLFISSIAVEPTLILTPYSTISGPKYICRLHWLWVSCFKQNFQQCGTGFVSGSFANYITSMGNLLWWFFHAFQMLPWESLRKDLQRKRTSESIEWCKNQDIHTTILESVFQPVILQTKGC